MECDEVKVLLWEYLDRELASTDARALARHLGECSGCYPAYSCNQAFLSRLASIRSTCRAPAALMRWVRSLSWVHDLI
jgi:anti-sigma factor (TIGR02949 family)